MHLSTGIVLIVDREDEGPEILRTGLQSTDYVLLQAKTGPSDPYANLQADLDRHRVEFMKNELALCFTFSTIAARKYETENRESADKAMANAEKAYETLIQYLSDPKHATHLTKVTIQEWTVELKRLRDRLDGLRQRFKTSEGESFRAVARRRRRRDQCPDTRRTASRVHS